MAITLDPNDPIAVLKNGQRGIGLYSTGPVSDLRRYLRLGLIALILAALPLTAFAQTCLPSSPTHVCTPGVVRAWGNNSHGQLGNGTGAGSNVPVEVIGLTNVVQVGAGRLHSVALKSNGTVWAWGDNLVGQLGNGLQVGSNIPVQVSGLDRRGENLGEFFLQPRIES